MMLVLGALLAGGLREPAEAKDQWVVAVPEEAESLDPQASALFTSEVYQQVHGVPFDRRGRTRRGVRALRIVRGAGWSPRPPAPKARHRNPFEPCAQGSLGAWTWAPES